MEHFPSVTSLWKDKAPKLKDQYFGKLQQFGHYIPEGTMMFSCSAAQQPEGGAQALLFYVGTLMAAHH